MLCPTTNLTKPAFSNTHRFGARVQDFPPDETSLMGAAIGYAQSGFLPVCEIPYAKYLDCGADMFFEAVLMHWLSAGTRPNGMLIRLQGFGKGESWSGCHMRTSVGVESSCFLNCGVEVLGEKGWFHETLLLLVYIYIYLCTYVHKFAFV